MLEEARPPAVDERTGVGAAAAFDQALRTCVDCTQYHALRPYLRASGVAGGVTNDWAQMEPAAARLIAEGRRRVLVVGAGDTGIAALVLTAARGHRIALTVIDRCATPLVLIQQMAARHGHRVAVRQDDLQIFDRPDAFDLVVGHHVMQFLPPGGPERMLRQAAAALAPGGRLLLMTRDRGWRHWRDKVLAPNPEDYAASYKQEVLQGLTACGVALPDANRGRFEDYLEAAVRARVQRAGRYDSRENLLAKLEGAGLAIEASEEAQYRPAWLDEIPAADRPRIGIIAVARPRRHDRQ